MRRGSILAPLLLTTVGVMFLLIQRGRIDRVHFWSWYGQWWPLLLVGAGLVVLAEWAVVVTGGFELERPSERGAPVLFHPNSVSSRETVTAG